MTNPLAKVIFMIVAVILMFFLTSSYFMMKKSSVVQVNVEHETAELVELVTTQSYITRDMYEHYLEELYATGKLYEVELTHDLMAFEPEYRFRKAAEVVDEDEAGWTGSNDYVATPVSTMVPEVVDPVSTLPLNTETNASVLASAVNTPASPTHVHSDSCYNGTKHTHTGSSSSGGGCYGGGGDSSRCGSSLSHVSDGVVTFDFTCTNCGATAYGKYYTHSFICGNSHTTSGTSHFEWTCSGCGASYSTDNSPPTECSYVYTSYSLNCGKTGGAYYSGNTQVYPCCNQKVLSVVPTHATQTVAVGDPLITTVTANYMDGSAKAVVGTSTFNTNNIGQNQMATISYSYLDNGVNVTRSCTITVTVVPRNRTCIYGHIYNLNNNGTDPGCPYCRNFLLSLTVYSPSTGTLDMGRNPAGSLETEGVGVLATYLDGHTEIVFSGYADNLDPDYVGTQTVTISYKGVSTTLQVNVLRNRKQCDICGLYYNLYLDNQDPGCPFCKANVPIFTGNVLKYCKASYENEIIEELYEGNGRYYFRRGDVFRIETQSKKSKASSNLIARLFDLRIQVINSQTVQDEEVHH